MMGSVLVIILVFAIFARLGNSQPAATIVYGQGGSFTSSTENNGGISAGSLSTPNGLALDSTNGLYVADTQNNRILYYLSGSTVATRVYGQFGSFTQNSNNNGGITANSLSIPNDITLDSSNNLYIADGGNNRVLLYSAGSTTATRVYGQANSFGTNTVNKGGVSVNSLAGPGGITFDNRDRLYVADTGNNRVLVYFPGSTTASIVYGQGGSFSSTGFTPITANSLFQPSKVYLDSVFNVYIVDSRDIRVLSYPFNDPNPTTATSVYGQAGSFTTATCCPGVVSAQTLATPTGITSDIAGNLYVGDTINNRVLVYASGATTANKVYGQANSFTTAGQGVSVNALNMPTFVAVSTFNGGGLYVSDTGNNRIVYYPDPAAGTTTTTKSSSPTSPANSSSTTCFHESTIITYKGKEYNMKNLNTAYTGNECHIPHIVRADGLAIYIGTLFGKHLRVTADHLIYTAPHGDLVAASTLMVGDRVYLSLDQRVTGIVTKIFEERDQTYFGLNCLESIVLANGVKASTFGKQHEIPAKWMSIVGGIFGVERASRWGDKIATTLVKIGVL